MSVQTRNTGDLSILEMRERAAREQGREIVQPKYVDWFEGQQLAAPAVKRPPEPKVVDLRAEQIRLTLETMNIVGAQTYRIVAPRMPETSRLRKDLLAKVLPEFPKLGVCRVGSVVLAQHGQNEYSRAEFYVTNFDAKLSTTARRFYTPTSDKLGGMFFGIGVIADERGKIKGFDYGNGRDGLFFQTKDITKAIYGIAAISTGMSVQQLMELDSSSNNTVKKLFGAAAAAGTDTTIELTEGRKAMIARV